MAMRRVTSATEIKDPPPDEVAPGAGNSSATANAVHCQLAVALWPRPRPEREHHSVSPSLPASPLPHLPSLTSAIFAPPPAAIHLVTGTQTGEIIVWVLENEYPDASGVERTQNGEHLLRASVVLLAHSTEIVALALTPTGLLLAVSMDGLVTVWRLPHGRPITLGSLHSSLPGPVRSAVFVHRNSSGQLTEAIGSRNSDKDEMVALLCGDGETVVVLDVPSLISVKSFQRSKEDEEFEMNPLYLDIDPSKKRAGPPLIVPADANMRTGFVTRRGYLSSSLNSRAIRAGEEKSVSLCNGLVIRWNTSRNGLLEIYQKIESTANDSEDKFQYNGPLAELAGIESLSDAQEWICDVIVTGGVGYAERAAFIRVIESVPEAKRARKTKAELFAVETSVNEDGVLSAKILKVALLGPPISSIDFDDVAKLGSISDNEEDENAAEFVTICCSVVLESKDEGAYLATGWSTGRVQLDSLAGDDDRERSQAPKAKSSTCAPNIRHHGKVICLTLAQPRWGSKKWLVSGGEDATAIAWSVPHGEPIHRFSLPMPPVALVPCEELNSVNGDNLAWMGCLASLDETGGAAILSLEPRGGRVLSSLPAPPGASLISARWMSTAGILVVVVSAPHLDTIAALLWDLESSRLDRIHYGAAAAAAIASAPSLPIALAAATGIQSDSRPLPWDSKLISPVPSASVSAAVYRICPTRADSNSTTILPGLRLCLKEVPLENMVYATRGALNWNGTMAALEVPDGLPWFSRSDNGSFAAEQRLCTLALAKQAALLKMITSELESAISQRVNEWNEPRVAFGALMLLAENWQSFPESMRLSARELFFLALKKINSAALSREAKLVSREPREPTRVLALALAAVERGITDILNGIVEPLVTIVENCSTLREKIHSTIAAEIIYENFELLKGMLNVDLRYSLMISAVTLGGFASEEGEPADINWKQHAGEKGVELLYIVACDDCGLFLRFLLRLLETSKVSGEHSTALLALIRIIECKPDVITSHLASAGKALQAALARSEVRKNCLATATAAIQALVAAFPHAAFHQGSMRLAVGNTADPLAVADSGDAVAAAAATAAAIAAASLPAAHIFDISTARTYALMRTVHGGGYDMGRGGGVGPVSALAFSADGSGLASFSARECAVRYWALTSSTSSAAGYVLKALTGNMQSAGPTGTDNSEQKCDKYVRLPLDMEAVTANALSKRSNSWDLEWASISDVIVLLEGVELSRVSVL